jgi:hypothetical protein
MARVLHLLSRHDTPLAADVIGQEIEAGDDVTVALLAGVAAPDLPGGVRARRVPAELSYQQLLEEIFSADQVITW